MRHLGVSLVLGSALIFASMGVAAAAANDSASMTKMLKQQGYHHIQVVEAGPTGGEAFACKGDAHFRVATDTAGQIVNVDPVGDCTQAKGPNKVRVQAPFTDVEVGDGVRVRAPGVDINIR
jgi:hypothetical protein